MILQMEETEKGNRIDKVLAGRYAEYSRSFLQRLIQEGQVQLLGKKKAAPFLELLQRAAEEDSVVSQDEAEEDLGDSEDVPEENLVFLKDKAEESLVFQQGEAEEKRAFQHREASEVLKLPWENVKAGYKAAPGDWIQVRIPAAVEPEILAENIPLSILYEDDELLVIDKPKNMVVHPCPGHYSGTLVNALMYHCRDRLSGINGVLRPGIVHRIDQNTTGSLLVCKNDFAHNFLAEQLREHTITRKYRAIVHGNLKEDEGTIDAPVGRHPVDRKKMAVNYKNGKEAVTHYRVLERFGSFTYVECRLETGRTHQIRVHMASKGHPLLGDDVYGPAHCPVPGLTGQTLHAMTLGFVHPKTKEYMEFEAPLPAYFEALLERLRRAGR